MKKLPVLLLLSVFSVLCGFQVIAQAEAGTGPTPLEQFKSTAKKHLKLLVEHSDKERNANFAKTQAEKMLALVEAASDEDGFDVEEFKRIQISGAFLRKFSRARMDAVLKAHEKYEVDSAELRAALEEEKKKAAAKQAIAEAEAKTKAEAEARAAAEKNKQREASKNESKKQKTGPSGNSVKRSQDKKPTKDYQLETGDLTLEQHVSNIKKIIAMHMDHAPVDQSYSVQTNVEILRKVTEELLGDLDEYYYKHPVVILEIDETRVEANGMVQIAPVLKQPGKSKYFPWKSVAVFTQHFTQEDLKKGRFKSEFLFGQEGLMFMQMRMESNGEIVIYNPAFMFNHLYFLLYPEDPEINQKYLGRKPSVFEKVTHELHQKISEKLDLSKLSENPDEEEILAAKQKLKNEIQSIIKSSWAKTSLMKMKTLGYVKYEHERFEYSMRFRHSVVKAEGKYPVNYAHVFYSESDLARFRLAQHQPIMAKVKLEKMPEIQLVYDKSKRQWNIDYLGVFEMSAELKSKLKIE